MDTLLEKLLRIQTTLSQTKTASTALTRRMQAGLLSPATINRAASAMPEGKFRYLSHLGTGQFTAADRVVGNMGEYAGEMARKIPIRVSPNYVREGEATKAFVDKINSNASKRHAIRSSSIDPFVEYGRGVAPPIAPYVASTEKGLFQQLANGVPIDSKGVRAYVKRRIADLHRGNYGPNGQILDASPNLIKLAPGVPDNYELAKRGVPSFISSRVSDFRRVSKPNTHQLNQLRKLLDSRLGTYAENVAKAGTH